MSNRGVSAAAILPDGYRILDHDKRQVCLWPLDGPRG